MCRYENVLSFQRPKLCVLSREGKFYHFLPPLGEKKTPRKAIVVTVPKGTGDFSAVRILWALKVDQLSHRLAEPANEIDDFFVGRKQAQIKYFHRQTTAIQ